MRSNPKIKTNMSLDFHLDGVPSTRITLNPYKLDRLAPHLLDTRRNELMFHVKIIHSEVYK